MKNKILTSLVLLILSASLILSGCTVPEQPEGDSESLTESEGASESESVDDGVTVEEGDIAVFEDGKCLFKNVVYAFDATDEESEIAVYVHTSVRELTSSIKLKDDSGYKADTKEIVVALASSRYPEIEPLKEGLRYSDYVIAMSGNKLVVTAQTLDGLEAGAKKLVKMMTANAGKIITDIVITEVRYEASYKTKTFTVSGNDIKDYTIIYPKTDGNVDINHLNSAKAWQRLIGEAYGYILPISDDSTSVGDKEILIGSTNRPESEQALEPLHYNVKVSGSKLVVSCGGLYSAEKCIPSFTSTFMSGKKTTALDESSKLSGDLLTEPELARTGDTDIRVMAYNILCEKPNWHGLGNFILDVQPRLEIFLANLYAYRPDVIAVTECSEVWSEYLHEHLGNGYKLILNKFEDGKDNYSAIIYNSETVRLDGSGLVRYSKYDGSHWCRNMAWGEFTVRSTGKEFAFISTHWDVNYPQAVEEADEFNAKIVELSKNGTRPVMTGGDMNARVDDVNYVRLMGYGNVNNAKQVTENLINDIGSCKLLYQPPTRDPYKTIDHIFITKDVTCKMFVTLEENATIDMSDHAGVMADMKF